MSLFPNEKETNRNEIEEILNLKFPQEMTDYILRYVPQPRKETLEEERSLREPTNYLLRSSRKKESSRKSSRKRSKRRSRKSSRKRSKRRSRKRSKRRSRTRSKRRSRR